jgi:hypothetical protein
MDANSMIKRKIGICTRCQEEADKLGVAVREKMLFRSAPKLCLLHNNEFIRKKAKPVKTYLKRATGELDMFNEIWAEREHVSFVSGETIMGDMSVWYMAHILPKGSYQRYRLRKDNIVLLTKEEHTLFDHASHKIKDDPMWQPLLELKQEMKEMYNREMKIDKF